MRKAVQVVLGLVAGGAVAVSYLFAIAWADEALPRSAEQLRPPKLRSHLPPERIDVLAGRWIAQIDPTDVAGSIAAIELLGGAPKVFVDAARLAAPTVGSARKGLRRGKRAAEERVPELGRHQSKWTA